jgi:hypothetical protein
MAVPIFERIAGTAVMVHLLAAFAEHEREQISPENEGCARRSPRRGASSWVEMDRITWAPVYRAQRQLAPVLAELRRVGMSARQIAAELLARGIPTSGGERWHPQTVLRIINRLDRLSR